MTYDPPPILPEDHVISPKKTPPPPTKRRKKVMTGFLSPVQTVVIGDDNFNYHARLNTNCY